MTTKQQLISESPYKPVLAKITEYVRETHDSFTIKLDWKIHHQPGQFVFCSLPGIGEAPISICSHSDEYIELNIREVGNVTKKLGQLKVGDELLVRGPYGRAYPMRDFEGNNIIIIGGGCGVAPLKGSIEFIEQYRNKFRDVSLFFGFRTPDDTLFRKRMDVWKEKFNMHVSFDKVAEPSKACYDGSQGFVTQKVNELVGDNTNTVVFICGPPIMIEKTSEILLNKGFKEEQIFVSAERLMYCGMGKCGRCMIHGRYTCLDGAVFRYDELKDYKDD
ncbi:FAD/NAD(P)-binding protein [Candidatus Woesearchaeota archaeon]|nr:FAD/NAD(P)-binding protein [Candidatus Woesearchaeota archaeon]